MVERKKIGTKQQRSGGSHYVVDNGLLRQDNGIKNVENRT